MTGATLQLSVGGGVNGLDGGKVSRSSSIIVDNIIRQSETVTMRSSSSEASSSTSSSLRNFIMRKCGEFQSLKWFNWSP